MRRTAWWRGTLAGLVAMLGALPAAAESPALALPQLDVTSVDGGLHVEGGVLGLSNGTVEASLVLTREDASGRTNTRQSRSIEVVQGSHEVLASTRISAGTGTELHVTLTLSSENQPFARSEIRLAPDGDFSDISQ